MSNQKLADVEVLFLQQPRQLQANACCLVVGWFGNPLHRSFIQWLHAGLPHRSVPQ